MCEQALHPPRRPGPWLGEEGKQRGLGTHNIILPGVPAVETGNL
jgi:hypothetical protein